MKYANTTIKNDREVVVVTLPLSEVPLFDPDNPPQPNTYTVSDEVEVGWVRENGEFYPPPKPTITELNAMFTAKVQARLDKWARERNYDSIHTAVSYRGDENHVFAAEGEYAHLMRSRTWSRCYEVIDEVLTGKRTTLAWEELEAELPELNWSLL